MKITALRGSILGEIQQPLAKCFRKLILFISFVTVGMPLFHFDQLGLHPVKTCDY